MGIFFLILSFVFIFSIFFVSSKEKDAIFTNFRLSFVKSSLIVSTLVVIFTEFLSFFRILTSDYIILLWLIISIISLVFLIFLIKKNKLSFSNLHFEKILFFLKKERIFIKGVIVLISIIIILLFCVALTINHNWDSYTYHLPKVEHWIQNKNVDFFTTNNIRQLYLAPFTEYFILNLRLLSRNILFINFVQFFSLINCLLLASLIAKLFQLSKRGQLASLILALTIPMGLLQSTTTQTDLTVSFFVISFVYFGLSIIKERKILVDAILFLCLSFSLGILTKATFYIFAFPFCLFFGIYYIRLFKFKSFLLLFSIILAFSLLNLPFLNRNYVQFGSPLGPQESHSLNEKFGVKETLSNSIKNIGLHLATPNNSWNIKIDQTIARFHSFIKFPLTSVDTSFRNMKYKTAFAVDHDRMGNFLHIILFFISCLIIFIKFKTIPKLIKIYFVLITSGFILFAFLLKWQPWQTRLDLPIFFLMTPFLVYALSHIKWKSLTDFICITFLFISSIMVFVYEQKKPILGKTSIFLKNNSSYIFDYNAAMKIESELKDNDISNIGLILGGNSWEWQYWLLSKNRRFEYILFNHDLLKTPNFDSNFKYRAAIVTRNLWDPQKHKDILEIININKKTMLVIYRKKVDVIITK